MLTQCISTKSVTVNCFNVIIILIAVRQRRQSYSVATSNDHILSNQNCGQTKPRPYVVTSRSRSTAA